jgi:uncharacterized RDD family membrane protein YckC
MDKAPEYAGFFRRAVAYFIDGILIITIVMMLQHICLGLMSFVSGKELSFFMFLNHGLPTILQYFVQSILLVVWALVQVIFLRSKWQATIGKRLMNAYVVTVDSKKISVKTAWIRSLSPFVFLAPLQLYIPSSESSLAQISLLVSFFGLIIWYGMVAFTSQKTALHDFIAQTRVLKGTPVLN